MSQTAAPTAALLVIGNEILSGRTQDANIHHLAGVMVGLGIRLREVRVVPDEEALIIAALDALRAAHTYVFTTGGIGPTHDDITAASVAKAFGVALRQDPEARRRLEAHYAGTGKLNEARLRMANIPEGATLIDNPVSAAPGFQIGNVYVMAGVPMIMQAMLAGLANRLIGGAPILARTVRAALAEGDIALGLEAIQARHPTIDIGSYPTFRQGTLTTALVLRGTDVPLLEQATAAVADLVRGQGVEPEVLDGAV